MLVPHAAVRVINKSARVIVRLRAVGWHHVAGERLQSLLETGLVEPPGRFEELIQLYSP